MDEQTINRIKRYLNKKINPKVIALELGVPIELVNICERELLLDVQKEQETRPVKPSDSTSYLKMKVLRDKYKKVYYSGENIKKQTSKNSGGEGLSEDKVQEAEMIIVAIEEKTLQISNVSNLDARKIAIAVIEDVKKLQPIQPLPVELADRFKRAIDSIEIAKTSKEDRVPTVIGKAKKMASERLVQAIDLLQEKLEDIEELRRISQMLTPDLERQKPIEAGRIKSQIRRKIEEDQKKRALEKIKNIPPNIARIVESLANGDIDIKTAKKIIEEEAKSRVASRRQNRFAVTEEQEKKQIALQIINAISENPDKYHFKSPEEAIEQIQELCGTDKGQTIRAVVINLIGRKHFETAKRICRKFSSNDQGGILAVYVRRLFEDIKNAEFGEMVLRGIKMEGTPEELGAYYEALEIGLKREGINPRAVSLGKNQDGSRNITLADIWLPEAKNKNGTNR